MRFERRLNTPKHLAWSVPLLSLAAAILAGAILLLITGHNPIDTYHRIFERGFASQNALSKTLVSATPLLFTGLCAAAAFRMGVFNIGGEGQLFMGAVGASLMGLALDDQSKVVIVIAMVLGGMAFGALYAVIPGVLRALFNTNEIITTLMLNYIAGVLLNYLIFNSTSYWRDPRSKGFPSGKRLIPHAWWGTLGIGQIVVPLGFILAVVTAVCVWVLYRKTRFGFEVTVIGDAPAAARYAGMRTKRKVVAVMAISGGLAGLGGASDVGDFRHVLDAKGLPQASYGYTGIVVAALARLNPLAVILVSILIGGLTNAGYALQGPDFPSGLVGTLQGLILFFSVAGEVLTRYRLRLSTRSAKAAA